MTYKEFADLWQRTNDTFLETNTIEAFTTITKHLIDSADGDFDISITTGAYFGKEITIVPKYFWGINHGICVAFDEDLMTIFRANHDGFWVQPFIEVSKNSKEFADYPQDLRKAFMYFIKTQLSID